MAGCRAMLIDILIGFSSFRPVYLCWTSGVATIYAVKTIGLGLGIGIGK
jgi:hypothetical protein